MMRTRHTLLYLLVLALLAGYFFYFEVFRRREKEQEEVTAKRVFQVQAAAVQALEISTPGKPPLRLDRDGRWRITEPRAAEADETAVNSYLNTLQSLESARQVEGNPSELAPYGLADPSLRVRFKVGEEWRELLAGDKNPVGDGHYAMTAERPAVFLIAVGNWGLLNKGFDDLRRRQLLVFDPASVLSVGVSWASGEGFVVAREAGDTWKAPGNPEMSIKGSKVGHLLDQVHWLRALTFMADDASRLGDYGLAPPQAVVSLRLNEGREIQLLLGKLDEAAKRVAAHSSELPGVVGVEANILESIPRGLDGLEERSLVGFKPEQVRQVVWRLPHGEGHVVQTDGASWAWSGGGSAPQALKNPWRVRALLWELESAEHDGKREPTPAPPPGELYGYVGFWDHERQLASLVWERPVQGDPPELTVWRTVGGEEAPQAYLVKTTVIDKIAGKLGEISGDRQP
jgi:hypothetical protein